MWMKNMKENPNQHSMQWFQRAQKVLPRGIYGHQGPTDGCLSPPENFPLFTSRAEGSYFWDVDNNRYIDYMCAYGPNILGYGDKDVDMAAQQQLAIANCTTAPHTLMVDLAETLVDTIASADWAFFAKNGTDVTTLALLTAKAYTGKEKVIAIKGGYHGVAPCFQADGTPGITTVDNEHILRVDWNNISQIKKQIKNNPDNIAAFIATPYHHPVFARSEMPSEHYWHTVRKLCNDNGIVLIIDDVRCGFRMNMEGSDSYFGFKADLICYCKALANGWSIAALCGNEKLKSACGSVRFTGSYWLSAAPMAACLATLEKLKKLDAPKLMRTMGEKLLFNLEEVAEYYGFKLDVSGHPSLFSLQLKNASGFRLHQAWIGECVKRGVYFTMHHNHFINCSLTDADIEETLKICGQAFEAVKKEHSALL